MSTRNGYMITYYSGMTCIDTDIVLGVSDAEEHVQVALGMPVCSSITLHCLDRGDVLYTRELFRVDDKWMDVCIDNLSARTTIGAL